MDDAWDS